MHNKKVLIFLLIGQVKHLLFSMKAFIIIQFKRKKREIKEKSEKEKREGFHEN